MITPTRIPDPDRAISLSSLPLLLELQAIPNFLFECWNVTRPPHPLRNNEDSSVRLHCLFAHCWTDPPPWSQWMEGRAAATHRRFLTLLRRRYSLFRHVVNFQFPRTYTNSKVTSHQILTFCGILYLLALVSWDQDQRPQSSDNTSWYQINVSRSEQRSTNGINAQCLHSLEICMYDSHRYTVFSLIRTLETFSCYT